MAITAAKQKRYDNYHLVMTELDASTVIPEMVYWLEKNTTGDWVWGWAPGTARRAIRFEKSRDALYFSLRWQ